MLTRAIKIKAHSLSQTTSSNIILKWKILKMAIAKKSK